MDPITLRSDGLSLPRGPFWLKQKYAFHMPTFVTTAGAPIDDLKFGYETYGALNSNKDNAILVCHYFSGNSNAAGKYSFGDAEAGYWDAVIGPDKAIDTNRFFVICADTICNLCPFDPKVITTGPASLNPKTGRVYGPDFPILAAEDLIKAQKCLVDALGIQKLYAVAGPSMGAMQALQWAVSCPEMVERVIAAIGPGLETPSYVSARVDLWAEMIKADPQWQNGNYDLSAQPIAGIERALRLLCVDVLSAAWAQKFGPHEIQDALAWLARSRSQFVDANHFLYLIKLVQTFSVRRQLTRLRAKVLFIAAESDLLMLPEFHEAAIEEVSAAKKSFTHFRLAGNGGHLDGLYAIERAASSIGEFLSV